MRKSIAAYSEKDMNVAAGKGPQTEWITILNDILENCPLNEYYPSYDLNEAGREWAVEE